MPALPWCAPGVWHLFHVLQILESRSPESICLYVQTGHTYERANIERHLARSDRAPLAGIRLTDPTLMPNIALRKAIEAWNEEQRAADTTDEAAEAGPADPAGAAGAAGAPCPPPDTSGDAVLARMLAEELNMPGSPSQTSSRQGPASSMIHERSDGVRSTTLRKKADPARRDWVAGMPAVQEGETVTVLRAEGAFSLVRLASGAEGFVQSKYLRAR